jgi:ribA/ribD-fused uncharacterized protein
MNWELETDNGIYFWGGILSNWAKSNFRASLYDGGEKIRFNTAEQYMMRIKAEFFDDPASAKLIMQTASPKEQKRLGRAIRGYSDEGWNPVARDLSYVGIYQKFAQNKELRELLLSTGNKILAEASPVDKKWGVGLEHLDPRIHNKAEWPGKNWLGQILMKVRDDLRNGTSSEFTLIDWSPYE